MNLTKLREKKISWLNRDQQLTNKYTILFYETFSIQMGTDYAKQGYKDFTVVIQPFKSFLYSTNADKLWVEFLSDVSSYEY